MLVYTAVLNGLNIRANDEAIRAIAADPRVAYIEVNERGTAGAGHWTQPRQAPLYTEPATSWGLDRIDERTPPLDSAYTMARNGFRVHAYVIDTGVSTIQAEFGGRVTGGVSFINDGRGTSDFQSSYLSHTTTATQQLINFPVGSTRHVRVRAIKDGSIRVTT